MTKQLDLLEENREMASIRLADYQQRFNRNVKPREFVASDLVLLKVVGNIKEPILGKLTTN